MSLITSVACRDVVELEDMKLNNLALDIDTETFKQPRPSRFKFSSRQDVGTSRDGLETETSRPRRRDRDYIPGLTSVVLFKKISKIKYRLFHCAN